MTAPDAARPLTAAGQTAALSPASATKALRNCPAWCELDHADGLPSHFGAPFEMDLSLAEPGYVPTTAEAVSDFMTLCLWQETEKDGPVISGLASGLDDTELQDLTLDEAEAFALELLDLVRRARAS